MTLPTPDRNLPDQDDTAFPGPGGGAYADKVAAEVERIWQLVPNPLINVAGTANAITAECLPPLIADVTHGQPFFLVPVANNAGGGVTIDIDSRGPIDVVAYDGTPLVADDLVDGEGQLAFGFESGSPPTIALRLAAPTPRQLIELSSVSSPLWEQFHDSGSLGTVANVEATFAAGRYSSIHVVASDISLTANTQLVASLRHAGGAIVSLQTSSLGLATVSATLEAKFAVGLIAATKHHVGRLWGDTNGGAFEAINAVGTNATAPDRVRLAPNSGSIDAGRVMMYGLLATAP